MLSLEYLEGLDRRVKDSQAERDLGLDLSIYSNLHDASASLKLALDEPSPFRIAGRSFFYKGGGYTRLRSIFNPDESLNLTEIISTPPCEFHPSKYDLHFIKQENFTREYTNYTHHRVSPHEPAIMTAAIPSDFCSPFCSSSVEVFGLTGRNLFGIAVRKSSRR